jgi:hypothetical protein
LKKKIAIVADREGDEGVQRYSRRPPRRGSSSLLLKKPAKNSTGFQVENKNDMKFLLRCGPDTDN